MLFSSPTFFVFFAAYLCLHFATPARYRQYLIIVASTVFYAWWRVEYVWLPYLLMIIAYGGALWMARSDAPRERKRRTTLTIVVLFLPLIFFKYTNFFYRDVFGPLVGWRGNLIDLPLPLGVSFITFTLTAYVVDTYKGLCKDKPGSPTLLAYVLFFPHLIAGPILRPTELIPQLERPRRLPIQRFAAPLAIFTFGLVKKLVFADQIAEAVDQIYQQTTTHGPSALLAMYGFSVQIYCDFSGYTDMAIGLALMLGVRLPNNFLRPYGATSIVDFWRRWHITLSFWLRDYLYIPLGGNRHGRASEIRNTVTTMALGGLWHGANWTFVVWGLLHGGAVAALHAIRRGAAGVGRASGLPRWLQVIVTFHFVTLAWVFFRAPTIGKAGQILRGVFTTAGWGDAAGYALSHLFVLFLIVVFFCLHRFDDHRRMRIAARRVRPEIFWPALALLWLLAITVSQGNAAKFIYFDF